MYLSGANAVAGSVCGSATAAAKRQTTSTINSGISQLTDVWANAFLPSTSSSKKLGRGLSVRLSESGR